MAKVNCSMLYSDNWDSSNQFAYIDESSSRVIMSITLPPRQRVTSITFYLGADTLNVVDAAIEWQVGESMWDTSHTLHPFTVNQIQVNRIKAYTQELSGEDIIENTGNNNKTVYFFISSDYDVSTTLFVSFNIAYDYCSYAIYEAILDTNTYIYPQGMTASIKIYYNSCALYVENPDVSGTGAGSGSTSGTGGFYWPD